MQSVLFCLPLDSLFKKHRTYPEISKLPKYVSVYIYPQMASKNLTVKEEVYNKLLKAKKGDESFSEVIERLLEGKKDLMSFAGIFSNDGEFEEATRDILEVRKKTTLRKL